MAALKRAMAVSKEAMPVSKGATPISKFSILIIGAVVVVGGGLYFDYQAAPIPREKVLASMGYDEVASPSDFYAPGTLNTIEVLSTGKLTLHPTCDVGSDVISSATKETPTISWQDSLRASADISSDIRGLLPASVGLKTGWKLYRSYRNATILTMSDEKLFDIRRKIITGDCEEVAIDNIKNGGIVCQVAEAIRADVVYDFSFSEGLDVGDKASIKNEILQNLKLEGDARGDNEIVGKGLFFGVKLYPNGLVLKVPDASPLKCKLDRTG